jgi:hypothetical protein
MPIPQGKQYMKITMQHDQLGFVKDPIFFNIQVLINAIHYVYRLKERGIG